jgi:hypothetical protein
MSFDVTIGGRATSLTLPQEGPETYNRSSPLPDRTMPRFPRPPLAEPRPPEIFAIAGHAAVTPEDALVVEAIRIRWRDSAVATSLKDRSSFAASEHSEQVGTWLAMVIDWLAAWYGQSREHPYREPTPPVRIVLVDDPDGQAFYAGESAIPSIGVGGSVIAGRPELLAAFAAASRGTSPPLEYQILSDARSFAQRGEYRYAVINACTAAEIALAQSPDAQRGDGEPKPSGIAELYKLIAGKRASLPVSVDRVIDQLAPVFRS